VPHRSLPDDPPNIGQHRTKTAGAVEAKATPGTQARSNQPLRWRAAVPLQTLSVCR
jgi:hypothetical protein